MAKRFLQTYLEAMYDELPLPKQKKTKNNGARGRNHIKAGNGKAKLAALEE